MGITNLDSVTLDSDLIVGGSLTVNGNDLKVSTVTAATDNTLAVSGLAVGDVVLGINATSDGGVGTPGDISAGAVACTQATSGEDYVVVWVDAT